MPSEIVTPVTGEEKTPSWWRTYRCSIQGLSRASRDVIDIDSDYIVSQGIFGDGDPADDSNTWPATRLRRGLVVGSVQSGKTASLLAVSAKSLDRGVDAVVILAGTRLSLWRQTIDRAASQLDGQGLEVTFGSRPRHRLWIPDSGEGASRDLDDLYRIPGAQVRRLLKKRRPIIALVMKQADHLMRFGENLRTAIRRALPSVDRPIHILVIDDEADDGSILDADVERRLDPESEALKQIPRHIARLWSEDAEHHTTFDHRLHATYLAYTATPQANILQADHNPLSPSDFVVALRTPGDSGSVEPPRASSFLEPEGLPRFYTGGEYFYARFGDGEDGLCSSFSPPDRSDYQSDEEFERELQSQRLQILGSALRAFFVAAALRLQRANLRYSVLEDCTNEASLREMSPSPHSMLIHPSAAVDDQFETAALIAAWSRMEEEIFDPSAVRRSEVLEFSVDSLRARLETEEPLWEEWLWAFARSQSRITGVDFAGDGQFPSAQSWSALRELLINEVFPAVQLRIINSDPYADDRPRYSPHVRADGSVAPAPDLLTVFVSGNVMSRGITLEGLSSTLFLRGVRNPAADTQMQMQRWFGYRGSHLDLCRVFLTDSQREFFASYHENDEALRVELIEEMNRTPSTAPKPLVLHGADYRATGKIANLRSLPLCPGPSPFIRVVSREGTLEGNRQLLGNLLTAEEWDDLVVSGTKRGVYCKRTFSMLEIASLLDEFRYEHHAPSPTGRNHERWLSLERELDLSPPDGPLFRPPESPPESPREAVGPASCPFSIAAYLRLWRACLSRRPRGLYPTDNRQTPWQLINLAQYASQAPRFYVGVRFGDEGASRDPRLKDVQCVRRQVEGSRVLATWGTRNPSGEDGSYLGDSLFDYHIHDTKPPTPVAGEPTWRPRGHPGLLLFHLLRAPDGDETLTAGLAIPLGGPDHFAALRVVRSDDS